MREVNHDDFGDLRVHFGPGHIIQDMYAMAEADLLIGPPSTYTGWASFYGNVPLVAMHNADQPIDISAIRPRPGEPCRVNSRPHELTCVQNRTHSSALRLPGRSGCGGQGDRESTRRRRRLVLDR